MPMVNRQSNRKGEYKQFSVCMLPEVKQKLDDYAWRHRMTLAAAVTSIINEAADRDQAGE